MMRKLEAEIICSDEIEATAYAAALTKAGFLVERRPDWDLIDEDEDARWLAARDDTDLDEDAFWAAVEAIVKPLGGMVWTFGEGWTRRGGSDAPGAQ